jgi:hypothetical protein
MSESKMTDAQDPVPSDAELSLPWYATGKLPPAAAEEMRQSLAGQPELERHLRLTQDERAETVRLNEGLGAPSRAAYDRLFARIDAAPVRQPMLRRLFGQVLDPLAERLAQISPRGLAFAASAAGVAICLQAGLVASLLVAPHSDSHYTPASQRETATTGTYLLIGFVPEATTASVTTFLESFNAVIADGPKPGGFYRVRIADKVLSASDENTIIANMRAQSAIVRIVLHEPSVP